MQEELYGTRDRTYSAWHRRLSTRRYIGIDRAQLLSMIDLDAALYIEYDNDSKEPLALIETARDVGQGWKSAGVTKRLAQRAGIPGYVLLYRCSKSPNPADSSCPDVDQFRVKRLWPQAEKAWRTLTPSEWASGLLRIRAWSAKRLDVEAANDPYYDQPGPQQKLAIRI